MRREDRSDADRRYRKLKTTLVQGGLRLFSTLAMALCALIGAATTTAAAQRASDEQARLHYQVATSYYEQADYESALREFQSAYRLSQRPQLLFNISLCYQQLGDLDQAIAHLERYLGEATEIENRPSLEQRLGNLRGRRDRQRATGHDPGEDTPDSGSTEASGGMTSGDSASGVQGRSANGTAQGTGAEESGAESSRDEPANIPAIVGFSVAGLGLITAAVLSGLTLAEDARVGALPCAGTRTCPQSEVGTLGTMALVADVSWGVSLAGAIVGAVFLFVPTGGSSAPPDRASLRLSPWLGQVNGLFLTEVF